MRKLRLFWRNADGSSTDLELFLATTDYQKAAFARRTMVDLGSREVWMLSVADSPIHKLVAHRVEDLADVQNILSVQGLAEPE